MTSVSVIVPAYNEGLEFSANLVRLADALSVYEEVYDFQYIIVDDGSIDETYAIAFTFARFRRNVAVLRHDRNYGLGRALRTAFERATGEYAIVVDADLSYSPSVAVELLETLERENADVVTASAYMRGGRVVNVPFLRRVLSREANRTLSLAANGRYATLTCMVRAYRTAFVKQLELREDGMESSAEIMLAAVRNHGRIVEVPAQLVWSEERRTSRGRPRLMKVTRQSYRTLRLAFTHRPALWLAVPGLIPGLLPLVVAILLLLHVRPATLALGTLITVIVQYTSLAIFAGQLGTFFARVFVQSRNATTQKAFHL